MVKDTIIDNNSRASFAKQLLMDLHHTDAMLLDLKSSLEAMAPEYYAETSEKHSEELHAETQRYINNIEKVKEIQNSVTEKINSWHEFTKNKKELSSLLYPLKFIVIKKKINSFIEKQKKLLSEINIENRFLKENITLLVHKLEINALESIKSSETYKEFDELSKKRELITSELEYLLPTIRGIYERFPFHEDVLSDSIV